MRTGADHAGLPAVTMHGTSGAATVLLDAAGEQALPSLPVLQEV